MSYRELVVREIKEVLRTWLGGKGFQAVAAICGVDRRTAQRYIEAAQRLRSSTSRPSILCVVAASFATPPPPETSTAAPSPRPSMRLPAWVGGGKQPGLGSAASSREDPGRCSAKSVAARVSQGARGPRSHVVAAAIQLLQVGVAVPAPHRLGLDTLSAERALLHEVQRPLDRTAQSLT